MKAEPEAAYRHAMKRLAICGKIVLVQDQLCQMACEQARDEYWQAVADLRDAERLARDAAENLLKGTQ